MLLSFPYYLQLVEKKFAIFILHIKKIANEIVLQLHLKHDYFDYFSCSFNRVFVSFVLWIKNAVTTHRCMNERVINKLIFWTFFSLILWNINYNYLWCFWRFCMQRHWLVQYDFWQEIFSWGKKCKAISFHSSFHYYIFTF